MVGNLEWALRLYVPPFQSAVYFLLVIHVYLSQRQYLLSYRFGSPRHVEQVAISGKKRYVLFVSLFGLTNSA